jgi:hypothetical protein
MFTAIHSSVLGKPNCANSKPYSPSIMSNMEVSFRPVKNESGNVNFIALIEKDGEETKIPKEMDFNEYESENTCKKKYSTDHYDLLDLNNNYIKTFYIGSITVVGLYILYRILDKTK